MLVVHGQDTSSDEKQTEPDTDVLREPGPLTPRSTSDGAKPQTIATKAKEQLGKEEPPTVRMGVDFLLAPRSHQPDDDETAVASLETDNKCRSQPGRAAAATAGSQTLPAKSEGGEAQRQKSPETKQGGAAIDKGDDRMPKEHGVKSYWQPQPVDDNPTSPSYAARDRERGTGISGRGGLHTFSEELSSGDQKTEEIITEKGVSATAAVVSLGEARRREELMMPPPINLPGKLGLTPSPPMQETVQNTQFRDPLSTPAIHASPATAMMGLLDPIEPMFIPDGGATTLGMVVMGSGSTSGGSEASPSCGTRTGPGNTASPIPPMSNISTAATALDMMTGGVAEDPKHQQQQSQYGQDGGRKKQQQSLANAQSYQIGNCNTQSKQCSQMNELKPGDGPRKFPNGPSISSSTAADTAAHTAAVAAIATSGGLGSGVGGIPNHKHDQNNKYNGTYNNHANAKHSSSSLTPRTVMSGPAGGGGMGGYDFGSFDTMGYGAACGIIGLDTQGLLPPGAGGDSGPGGGCTSAVGGSGSGAMGSGGHLSLFGAGAGAGSGALAIGGAATSWGDVAGMSNSAGMGRAGGQHGSGHVGCGKVLSTQLGGLAGESLGGLGSLGPLGSLSVFGGGGFGGNGLLMGVGGLTASTAGIPLPPLHPPHPNSHFGMAPALAGTSAAAAAAAQSGATTGRGFESAVTGRGTRMGVGSASSGPGRRRGAGVRTGATRTIVRGSRGGGRGGAVTRGRLGRIGGVDAADGMGRVDDGSGSRVGTGRGIRGVVRGSRELSTKTGPGSRAASTKTGSGLDSGNGNGNGIGNGRKTGADKGVSDCAGNGGRRLFPCTQCGFEFGMRSNLKRHISTVHEDQRGFRCDVCGASFGLKQNLVTHVRVKHERRRPFSCDTCGLKFGYKQVLQNHVRNIHSK